MTGSLANRRRLMVLADTGTRKVGVEAGTALVELPKVAAGLLEEMTGEPVMAYMAIGAEDVQALHEFMLSRQALGGLRAHLERQEDPTL